MGGRTGGLVGAGLGGAAGAALGGNVSRSNSYDDDRRYYKKSKHRRHRHRHDD
ncbi:hypothetical protein LMG19282_05270 [Cupriavidus campinensis]|nr:hypothetical protein LMG19282_05270 [Cupriavidus campinensis]